MLKRLAERIAQQKRVPRIPKYVQLFNALYEAIERGELGAGDQLPTELEMTDALPASLGTVQKALRMLSESGLIVRRHGHGTFVAGQVAELRNVWHFRFLRDDGTGVVPVYPRVLTIEEDRTSGPWTCFLETVDYYVRIDRLIDVNHEFNAFSSLFLPGPRFAALLEHPYTSLDAIHTRSVMREQFGVPLLRVRAHMRARTFEPRIAEELGLTADQVGLVCSLEGFTYRDMPASYHMIYVPSNVRPLEICERLPMGSS